MTMTLDTTGITAFYDGYADKLLVDYVTGNPRVVAAIKHALRFMPTSAERVLDIGCGIGWSTRELARHCSRAEVCGVDLSPKLIDLAKRLTLAPNVRYRVQDILDDKWQPAGTFDAIVMLDVYEHIPVSRRQELHGRLARLLGPRGVLVLTCPSPEHQAYLRQHKPEGLQPVDEDVDERAVKAMAGDVAGRVVLARSVRIWNNNDYHHIVIARPGAELPTPGRSEVRLLSPVDRATLVEKRLGVRVAGDKLVVPVGRPGPLVCIATPQLDAPSETFIRNHSRRLPLSVCVVHGRPIMWDDENRYLGPSLLARAASKIWRTLGRPAKDQRTPLHRSLARYFRQRKVGVVLAEYGITGVELLEACRIARLPLVVHFHGYDAYDEAVLTGLTGRRYGDLFGYASALVAVSAHMRQQLLKLGAPEQKLHVIPYGVDTGLFGAADPAAAPPRLLAVGRFVEKKAPHLLIVAMSRVVEAQPDARLIMIGTGPLHAACRQLAAALGVAHAIEFLGAQNHEVVARHVRGARAFVQHSITASNGDSEGMPNSILEAQVAGLPVIATRHTGIVDCVVDGRTGLLVDEQDVDAMADRMVRLVRDPKEAAALGRAARVVALERFPLEKSLARLSEVLVGAAS